MTYDNYNCAVRLKTTGTWNLHSRFPDIDDLDFFILLSSNTGILGNAGQLHHSAGATYQDALARWRVGQGLPCVSIDLARIKSVATQEDMAKLASMRTRMAKLGHMWLDEHVIEDLVETAILNPHPQIIVGVNGGPGVHWDSDSPSQLGRDARFIALRYRQQKQHSSGAQDQGNADLLANQLAEAGSRAEAERLVGEAIARKLTDIFAIPMEDVDMMKAPTEYGVDSLVAVELRNMLMHQVGSGVASFAILQSASLAKLVVEATAKSRHVNAGLQ